jgi:2-polyprenyl-6-hydroxyphenyl methylase/3-demethylubiquinone-9 3-methyltransferase
MSDYYSKHLTAEGLSACYEIAPPRVRQYLRAEIEFVAEHLSPGDQVLELGCGYGRFLQPLAARAKLLVGIDTSPTSLQLGRRLLSGAANCRLLRMTARSLGFRDSLFDVVLCVQNGLSAFHLDPRTVVAECLRVARPGGRVLLSSYSPKFWEHRLEWFRLQAACGQLGEIDEAATGNGVIVCKDGFHARTISGEEFAMLASSFAIKSWGIQEVDESSVFCEIVV